MIVSAIIGRSAVAQSPGQASSSSSRHRLCTAIRRSGRPEAAGAAAGQSVGGLTFRALLKPARVEEAGEGHVNRAGGRSIGVEEREREERWTTARRERHAGGLRGEDRRMAVE